MNAIIELKERLCDELDNIARSGKLDMSTLEKTDKLAGTAYHLSKLAKAMEDEYSGRSYRRSYDSYDGDYDGYSGRRRDSMGRYSRDGDELRKKLERLSGTGNDHEREVAQKLLAEMR